MRVFKTQDEIQTVLNQILDTLDLQRSKDWDFHGLRIKNASPSKDPYDYVVRKELTPASTLNTVNVAEYTIVITRDTPADGEESPPYFAGVDRDGNIIDVWVGSTVAPTTNCSVNFNINGSPLLNSDIILPSGSTGPVHSGDLVSPIPKIGKDTRVTMIVTTAGGVELLSGGVIVRRDQ